MSLMLFDLVSVHQATSPRRSAHAVTTQSHPFVHRFGAKEGQVCDNACIVLAGPEAPTFYGLPSRLRLKRPFATDA